MMILSILNIVLFASAAQALWPQPRVFQNGTTVLWLSPDVKLKVVNDAASNSGATSVRDGIHQVLNRDADDTDDADSNNTTASLQSVFNQVKTSIYSEPFVPRKFYPRLSDVEPSLGGSQTTIKAVTIKFSTPATLNQINGSIVSAEAYELDISTDGSTSITTASVLGARYALETFRQLFYAHSKSAHHRYLNNAPISIIDAPRFQHRGLNIDISRNVIHPKDVIRTLKGMRSVKLNRLHIHASDAQSWPLEVPALPRLAQEGAYHPSDIWSVADLDHVQTYGQRLGIDVFIEIDMPGHTTSIAASYPELITAAYMQPWGDYAAEPPAGQLKLNSPEVYTFLTTLFEDLMSRTAKHSKYFHFGGDEVNLNAYGLDETVNSTSTEVIQPLIQKLYDHVFAIGEKYSLTPILWEEVAVEWNLTLPKSAIVQTWRSNDALPEVLEKGQPVLFGPSTHWYLDCGFGAFINPIDPNNPANESYLLPPYPDWCTPYKNWRQVYSFNPLTSVPDNETQLILGGEAHIWGELTDSVTIDWMIWPRLAAAAEVLWHGPGTPVSEDATRRLAMMRERLLLQGISAGMVQMEYCLRNEGTCVG